MRYLLCIYCDEADMGEATSKRLYKDMSEVERDTLAIWTYMYDTIFVCL